MLRPGVNRQVDPVAEGVGGLAGQRLLQVPEHNADQEIPLARLGSEAADRRCGQPVAGGSGKHADLLHVRRIIAKGVADPAGGTMALAWLRSICPVPR